MTFEIWPPCQKDSIADNASFHRTFTEIQNLKAMENKLAFESLIMKKIDFINFRRMLVSITFRFGTPHYGWLPVSFCCGDFHLDFEASDAINNPLGELLKAVSVSKSNEQRNTMWWLEPGAYLFEFKMINRDFHFSILEIADIHNEHICPKKLFSAKGNRREIIMPFSIALKNFTLKSFETQHWPYK